MSEVLNQDEINDLLKAIGEDVKREPIEENARHKRFIRIYDFMRQELLTKDEVDGIFKDFGTLVQTKREFKLESVDTYTFGNVRECRNTEGSIVCEFNCEGSSVYVLLPREVVTSKKFNLPVVTGLVKKITKAKTTFKKKFSTAKYASLVPDDLYGVGLTYSHEEQLYFDVFFPETSVKTFFKNGSPSIVGLKGIEIPVKIVLGNAKISLDNLLNYEKGEVIELDRLAGEPASIFANDIEIGKAEIVVVGPEQRFGIRLI